MALDSDAPPAEGTAIHYVGSELEVFADARVWRAYWQAQIRDFIGKRVLEVGAGIGSAAMALRWLGVDRWLALEPDPNMVGHLEELRRNGSLPLACEPRLGTIHDLHADERFDSILYADVLEHIEHDGAELARAVQHLDIGGTLIVLAPAHQWLYSAFDAAIGHFRRYTLEALLDLGPEGMIKLRARYLDSTGLAASLWNRLVMKQGFPTPVQIKIWDRVMVRASRLIDPLTRYRVGKSVLIVWRKS